jgi:signal peptidase I
MLILGLWLFGIVDSVRQARAMTQAELPWYSRWYWCIACIVLASCARWAFIQIKEPVLGFNNFRIATPRMAPALRTGELILVDARAYLEASPKVGDIVAVRHWNGTEYVRYVSGVDGTTIELAALDVSAPRFHAQRGEIIGHATVILYSTDHDRIGQNVGGVPPAM